MVLTVLEQPPISELTPPSVDVGAGSRPQTILRPVMLISPSEYENLRATYAKDAVDSGCYEGVTNIARAMQIILKGYHLGIDPMESLMQIVYTGKKMTMQAQLMIALANRSRLLKILEIPNPQDAHAAEQATVRAVRVDRDDEYIGTFTMADAKRAGLAGRQIWQNYPGAMLVNRAVSLTLRRAIPEVLGGIYLSEEVWEEEQQQRVEKEQKNKRSNPVIIGRAPSAPPALPAGQQQQEDSAHREEQPPWWTNSATIAELVKRAIDKKFIEPNQGAADLLKLIGVENWQGFESSKAAGLAILAAVDKIQGKKSDQPVATPDATQQPAVSEQPAATDAPPATEAVFEVLIQRAIYNAQKRIIFKTVKHGDVIMYSRTDLANMLGEPFAATWKIRDWEAAGGKPTTYNFPGIILTYKVKEDGKTEVIGAKPDPDAIPF